MMQKLTLSLLLVILIAVIGIGGVLDNLFSQYQTQPINQSDELSPYRQLGNFLAVTLDKQPNPKEFIDDWPHQLDISAELESFVLPEPLKESFVAGEPLTLETELSISIHFILPVQQKVLTLNIPPITKKNSNSSLQLLLTGVFYISIIVVVLIWLYPLIKQLRKLRRTTKAFGEGKFQERINTKSISYIADIENEFNRMAQRIETLINDNRLLSDAVSHDLRTPLARLRFGIEALQETGNPQLREKYEAHLCRDIDEMEQLVSVLLNYARIEQSMIAVEKQNIDLNEIINHCIQSFTNNTNDNEKIIHWHPKGVVIVKGEINYLKMLINNLLGNALQYARNEIKLSVIEKNAKLSFIISDDGPGIAEEQRSKLMKPFMRGEQAHENLGYGMGLAIVVRIAQLHDARFSITDSVELGGAEFCVTFKRLKLVSC
jgi:two-component system OmpR family sensor kinase